ncbi:MAG TPA: hypothetical protein VGC13_28540 [Longimicrobium sp.]|uniref:hypothetical protein n=1 Tax=Longimicrobium sp. TaxID=2029185 RepID=UPI002ED7DC6C
MKKLKLDLDQIQVVSFAAETTEGSAGTINGFSPDTAVGCGGGTDDAAGSCRFCNPETNWEIC